MDTVKNRRQPINAVQLFSFDAMKLRIGTKLNISPKVGSAPNQIVVGLFGVIRGDSLLISLPTNYKLVEGERVTVRVFSSRTAFVFDSVVGVTRRNPDFMHLSYPTEINGTVIRGAPRVSTKIITSIISSGVAAGIMTDISTGGAVIDSDDEFAVAGDVVMISFRFKLHGVDATVKTSAVVKSVTDTKYAVQFVDMVPSDRALIQSLVYQQIVDNPEKVI